MTTVFYLSGKKATKAEVEKITGKEMLKRMVQEAKETFREDPYIENSFFLGKHMLTIEFK